MTNRKHKQLGFTIVELLVVIVVIAILAAIIIVSYNGITKRAIETSLKSDLSNAAKQLEIQYVENGSFPSTADGIQKSDSTTYQYSSDGDTYCLTATQSGGSDQAAFHVSNTGSVTDGSCNGGGGGSPPPVTYAIGDTGPGGGKVFYDKGSFSNGWQYMEVDASATARLSIGQYTPWCNTTTLLGTGTAIGTGKSNTDKMLAGCTASIAYQAKSFSGGGKTDWFIPSLEEIKLIRTERASLGFQCVGDWDYWSSSESGASAASVITGGIGDCSTVYTNLKTSASYEPYSFPVRQF